MPDRIVVFGAGLIGCYIGGRLAAAGANVTLIGRKPAMDAIRARGLRLTDLTGQDIRVAADKIMVSEDAAALKGASLVLLTTKSQATDEAAAAIAQYAPEATVLSFQNGVSNATKLEAALPRATVISGMVPYNVASPDAAHYHQGTAGDLAAGASPALDRWLVTFAAAGLPVTTHRDMRAVMWGKLVVNLNNAINALSGVPLAQQLAQRDFRRAVALSQRETLKLLRRAGIKPADVLGTPIRWLPFVFSLPNWLYRRLMAARGFKVDRHARSSMAEDLEAQRPTEIDHINGEVVALAHRYAREAPVNARIVELIRAAERGARPWTATALLIALKTKRYDAKRKFDQRRGAQ